MKISNPSTVPVYTVAGPNTARPLPDWLMRKRKRSLKNDPEFTNRVELLQDFEFEEAGCCVRASEDGEWLMSTGTYKPQIHTHYLPHLSLSFDRHTNSLNETFVLLSADYTKSIHLQADRFIEFHTAGGLHYSTRIPRFGRDLLYDRHSTEALIPSAGVNADGSGEVFRLNLEIGRFMKGYEVDVGGDDFTTQGGGSLQGGVFAGAVNTGAIAENSHNLCAFGTSSGTIEFWDPRSRNRCGILHTPKDAVDGRSEVTALQFASSGLSFATGDSRGIVHLYDLRSPRPLLRKDQGYDLPIKTLTWLDSSSSRAQKSDLILSADKKIIKIWDSKSGDAFTHVEPGVDMNHVETIKGTGMIVAAVEGKEQFASFCPQLGPAPRWCHFLDSITEEMSESADDPNAYGQGTGDIYDNYKFLTKSQLAALNIDHLVGNSSLLKPYMHGYFVRQQLVEQAKLISNPNLWQEQRAKSIQEKISKERESRIRGNKKVAVKVNRKLAERLLARQEKEERRRAQRVLEKGGDDDMMHSEQANVVGEAGAEHKPASSALNDPRFARLFHDEDFEVDETSHEFKALNPSTKLPKGLTAAEQEELESREGSSEEDSSGSEDEAKSSKKEAVDKNRISSLSYKKSGHKPQHGPQMVVSSSGNRKPQKSQDRTFGSRVSKLKAGRALTGSSNARVVGEREITFAPAKQSKKPVAEEGKAEGQRHDRKDRRSASGNVFRRM